MKWWEAVQKEFFDINKQQEWCMTSESLMHRNGMCIKNKWVFKIIDNDVYQTYLRAFRYSKVPGVDFSKNYSLVISDVTFHVPTADGTTFWLFR